MQIFDLPPQKDRLPYHFLLCDDRALRVELDTEKTEAVANFNDLKFGNLLSRYFDMLKGTGAEPVSLTA